MYALCVVKYREHVPLSLWLYPESIPRWSIRDAAMMLPLFGTQSYPKLSLKPETGQNVSVNESAAVENFA